MTELFDESLKIARDLKDNYSVGSTLLHKGDAFIYQGEYERAEECFAEAESIYQTLGDKDGIAEINRCRGTIALKQGGFDQALQLYTGALQTAYKMNVISLSLASIEGIAFVAQMYNDPIKALRLLSACELQRNRLKLTRIMSHQADYDTCLAMIRASLNNGRYEALWSEGNKFTLEQAAEYAMQP